MYREKNNIDEEKWECRLMEVSMLYVGNSVVTFFFRLQLKVLYECFTMCERREKWKWNSLLLKHETKVIQGFSVLVLY